MSPIANSQQTVMKIIYLLILLLINKAEEIVFSDGYCEQETVSIDDYVEFEFDLTLDSWHNQYEYIHIFDIGNQYFFLRYEEARYSLRSDVLYFGIENQRFYATGRKFKDPDDDGITVHHRIMISQTSIKWYMDGIIVLNEHKSAHNTSSAETVCYPKFTNGMAASGTIYIYVNESYYQPRDNPYLYKYLYHYQMDTLSGWQLNGNISTVLSSNCPSIMNESSIQSRKICVAESYNSFWNGQYIWKHYNKDLHGSIYYNTNSNKYMYEYYDSVGYTFYLNDYETDTIMMTRCILNETNTTTLTLNNIKDCIGKWEHYYDNNWHIDDNMVSTICNDICVFGNDDSHIPNHAAFVWVYYNVTLHTNVYRCTECIEDSESKYISSKQYYLYGAAGVNKDMWFIDNIVGGKYGISYCPEDDPGNTHLFELNKCFLGPWSTWDGAHPVQNGWYPDDDMKLSECSLADYDWNTLKRQSESQICVSGSMKLDLNGNYKWIDHDFILDAPIYVNLPSQINGGIYIYPYLNALGQYEYHIKGDNKDPTIHAKCNVTNKNLLNVAYCTGKWMIYQNNTWQIDTNLITTPCDDICIHGNDASWINGHTFVYSFFLHNNNTNVYYCAECISTHYPGGLYLWGLKKWIQEPTGNTYVYRWEISNDFDAYGTGLLTCDFYRGRSLGTNYIFSIDDCLDSVSWDTNFDDFTDFYSPSDVYVTKCNTEFKEICAKFQPKAELSRTYTINKDYKDFAIGFDISGKSKSRFRVYYSCYQPIMDYNILTTLVIPEMSRVNNFIYKLPHDCTNSSTISIKLINTDVIYIDDFYLYYNVNDKIFIDQMNNDTKWMQTSETAIISYNSSIFCKSDSLCYRMYVSSGDFVHITKTIQVNTAGYNYQDLNLQWSAQTNGFTDNTTIFTVAIQCDSNYLYLYDLCTLQQYDYDNDCTDDACAFQSYNLPPECAISSEIIISFELKSSSSTDNIYIDFVSLTHSDISGNSAPVCRPTTSPTKQPTTQPTQSPTNSPTSSPLPVKVNTVVKKTNKFFTLEWILILSGIILVSLCIICICLYMYRNKVLRNSQMEITNAMVILLAIGEYDQEVNDCDTELDGAYLSDLNGIEEDIKNLYELFGPNNLNYTILPNYNDIRYPKAHWTQHEIIQLLEDSAAQFSENDHIYDGLVVAISSHGLNNNICTSDYKMIEKLAIHRIFSTNYPNSRNKPRVHIFDCCDGDEEQGISEQGKVVKKRDISKSAETCEMEQGKNFSVSDIQRQKSVIWEKGTKNPDHKLVEIHAANSGFQSKLNSEQGSYMLYSFVEKTFEDLENNGGKYMYEIFDEIQQELEEKGKQKIITTYNDRTRFIRFKPNKKDDNDEENATGDNDTKALNISDEIVKLEMSKMVKKKDNVINVVNTYDYKNWDSDMVANWIISLDKQYKKYKDTLYANLKQEDVDGSSLMYLDKNDLHRFGIMSIKHKVTIMQQIKLLTKEQS
eukprot:169750_1